MKNKRTLVQCSTKVNKGMIRRESIDGVDHIIITSYTLPSNIVMNGILYPQEVRDKSYKTLNRTLAPIEHPINSNGQYISANDPSAIVNFFAGAYNDNVEIEETSNRIKIDKVINVQQAMKSDKGKRLLDRINELETSNDPRPIHTSVGVYISQEKLKEPETNELGQEYHAIANDMYFDHDSILLDSVGAAQPHQGVGIGVNSSGEELEVQKVTLEMNEETKIEHKAREMRDKSVIKVCELSFYDITRKLNKVINSDNDDFKYWVEEVYNTYFIYTDGQEFYRQNYKISDDNIEFVGLAEKVEQTFVPVNNQEGDAMKERMIAALTKAGIQINEKWSEDELFEQYQSMVANQASTNQSDNDETDVATVVANALKEAVAPLQQEIQDLKANQTASIDAEKDRMIDVIVNSGRYPEMEKEDFKLLPNEKIRGMYAKSVPSHGLPIGQPVVHSTDDSWEDFSMPE